MLHCILPSYQIWCEATLLTRTWLTKWPNTAKYIPNTCYLNVFYQDFIQKIKVKNIIFSDPITTVYIDISHILLCTSALDYFCHTHRYAYLQIRAVDPPVSSLHPQSHRALCFASTAGCWGSGFFLFECHSATDRAASGSLRARIRD